MEKTITMSLQEYEDIQSDLKLFSEIKGNSEFILETCVSYGRTYSKVFTNNIEAKDLIERINNLRNTHKEVLSKKQDKIKELELEIVRLKKVVLENIEEEVEIPWWCFWKS